MSNPIIASTTDKEELPFELQSITDDFILKVRPYKNCFLFTADSRVLVYSGLRVEKDKVSVVFQYNTDTSMLMNTGSEISVDYKDRKSLDELKTYLEGRYKLIREARLRFIELKQQFTNLEVEMTLPHNGFTL